MRRFVHLLSVAAVIGLGAATANGQAWYDTLFPESSHDFGTVARGEAALHVLVGE